MDEKMGSVEFSTIFPGFALTLLAVRFSHPSQVLSSLVSREMQSGPRILTLSRAN